MLHFSYDATLTSLFTTVLYRSTGAHFSQWPGYREANYVCPKHQYIATRFYNGIVCLGANEFSRQTRHHSTLAMSDFTGSS